MLVIDLGKERLKMALVNLSGEVVKKLTGSAIFELICLKYK